MQPLVLVTGATGLVGSTLTRQLVERDARVRILRRQHSRLDLLSDIEHRIEHFFGDVAEPESLPEAFEGVTHVYHVAAAIEGRGVDTATLRAVNVGGTRHVVDAALRAGVQRLVHTSSMAAFGRPESAQEAVLDETAEWTASRFNSSYAESKYLAELEVQRGIAEGLDAVIVNPALVFGAGRAGENTVQIVQRVRDERLPGIPEGGTNVVDVRDVAHGHVLAMERGKTGRRYFLGSENLLWRDIIETLAGALGAEPPRRVVPLWQALALGTVNEWTARLTGRAPLLTRARAQQVSARFWYSNRRAVEELGCTFRPFAETAGMLAEAFG